MVAATRTKAYRGIFARLRLVVAGALIVLAAIAAGPTPAGAAEAAVVSPLDCGPWESRAIITYATGGTGGYNCSGTYTPANVGVDKFQAGGWSGNFVWGGRRYGYCVGDVFDFTGDVRLPISSLYLSQTKIC